MTSQSYVDGLVADSLLREFQERLKADKDAVIQALGGVVRRNVENIALLTRLVHDMNAQVQRQAWEINRLNEALDLRGPASAAPPCGENKPSDTGAIPDFLT